MDGINIKTTVSTPRLVDGEARHEVRVYLLKPDGRIDHMIGMHVVSRPLLFPASQPREAPTDG